MPSPPKGKLTPSPIWGEKTPETSLCDTINLSMATGKSYFALANYRFISTDRAPSFAPDSDFELDESDLYRSNSPEFRKSASRFNKSSKRSDSGDRIAGFHPSSLPVNIPDWSKILKEEYRENRRLESDDEDDDVDEMVPPHELLARTRIASFSVHEGVGRTLKGRDQSRVRNAIWEKFGFQD